MKKAFFVCLIFLSSFFIYSSFVLATTIISPLLEIEAGPGETQGGIVKVFNETDEDLFLVSSIEVFKAGDETGQPIYVLPEQKDDFVNWFTVEQDSIILKPKQVVIIPFTINIPTDAVPGGYYAVIFWKTVSELGQGGNKVNISSQVGTLIFLKVKGEVLESGEVVEFSPIAKKNYFFNWPINFSVRFSNIGNVHLKPVGEIELKNWFGRTETLEINPKSRNVLPSSIRRFEVVWGESSSAENIWQDFWPKLKEEVGNFAFGKYTATLNLTYGISNQEISKQLEFWFIPIRLVFSLLALIIVLIVFFKINSKIKKIKRQARPIIKEPKNFQDGNE